MTATTAVPECMASMMAGKDESKEDGGNLETLHLEHITQDKDFIVKVTFRETMTTFFRINNGITLVEAFTQPFLCLTSVIIVWGVFLYGCYLAALVVMM